MSRYYIPARARLFRENGTWHITITGPYAVLQELQHDLAARRQRLYIEASGFAMGSDERDITIGPCADGLLQERDKWKAIAEAARRNGWYAMEADSGMGVEV
jgi:hypothetical protein